MDKVIIYASQYGTTKRYVQALSERTGIPVTSFKSLPNSTKLDTIVYMAPLYIGKIYGFNKVQRFLEKHTDAKIILAVITLLDLEDQETMELVKKQVPERLRNQIYLLPGALDLSKLNFMHRSMLKMLYSSLKKTPEENLSKLDKVILCIYGKPTDLVDFALLEPIQKECQ